MYKIKRKSKGFTLSEVLVTMGVIGLIAAFTIPALTTGSQDHEFRSSAKKIYSELLNAVDTMIIEGGLPDFSAGTNDELRNKFCEHLRCLKTGATNEFFAPFYNWYKNYDNGWDASTAGMSAALLANGMTIRTWNDRSNCTDIIGSMNNICGYINVDTNGKKNPNMFGKDFLYFWILKDDERDTYYLIPAGSLEDNQGCQPGSTGWSTSQGCAVYHINNKDLP